MKPKPLPVNEKKAFLENPPEGQDRLAAHIAYIERKLSETEARSWGRLLAMIEARAQENPEFKSIHKQLLELEALDPLNIERQIADEAVYKASVLDSVFQAAKEFKFAHDRYQQADAYACAINASKEDISGAIEIRNFMLVKREKLFSLIEEARMKIR
ncbi:MAG: hypothetical protein HC888_00170 [Candidatus Competibacteraceae bacterium]|nr:hypothetical protein [Candidatus Competibacteraceae bacterium]